MSKEKDILIEGDPSLPAHFFPLLEKGADLKVLVGGTLISFLTDQLKVDRGYVDEEIQTLFLNARAIDDPEKTMLGNGDTLALSGAMPGLVGATLRKGGRYAPMRREISAVSGNAPGTAFPVEGRIRLKLFNTVLEDLGPAIFARGVIVSAADLSGLLRKLKKDGNLITISIALDDCITSIDGVLTALEDKLFVYLKILGLNK